MNEICNAENCKNKSDVTVFGGKSGRYCWECYMKILKWLNKHEESK